VLDLVRQTLRQETKYFVRCAAAEILWMLAIVAIAAGTVVFALLAAYDALRLVWPAWAAAGGIAVLLAVLLAIACMLRAGVRAAQMRRARRRQEAARQAAIASVGDSLEGVGAVVADVLRTSGDARRAAETHYRRSPASSLLAAAAAGAVVGLLSGSRRPPGDRPRR
jgi:archaellum biogenesis protein FlaJ (TadC family)